MAPLVLAGLVLVFLVIVFVLFHPHSEWRTVKVDGAHGMQYRVHAAHANREEAAALMGQVSTFITEFLRMLRDNYTAPDTRAPVRGMVQRLLARYDPDQMSENSPLNPRGTTAYVYKKGKDGFKICLRSLQGRLHEFDLVRFVVLHELTHISMDEYGHGPDFWAKFKLLLKIAAKHGFYVPVNYRANPPEYCGMKITENPLFEDSIPDIAPYI